MRSPITYFMMVGFYDSIFFQFCQEINELRAEAFDCRCLNIFDAETSRAQLAPTRRALSLKSKIIGELNASVK